MDEAGEGSNSYSFTPVGIVHSPFREKYGIPRQPGLVPAAQAQLELLPPYDREEALRGLDRFSHLWLLFVFHGVERGSWRPTVRPPRLGGNERLGVFATRSTHRPNGIGMSVVEFAGIERKQGHLYLNLRNVDLLDGTPVLDIKPYVAYVDALPNARSGFAEEAPHHLPVHFSAQAQRRCEEESELYPLLTELIEQMLCLDPRPAYQQDTERRYGIHLYEFNVVWHFDGNSMIVDDIEDV